jgi:hypothetical protein
MQSRITHHKNKQQTTTAGFTPTPLPRKANLTFIQHHMHHLEAVQDYIQTSSMQDETFWYLINFRHPYIYHTTHTVTVQVQGPTGLQSLVLNPPPPPR